MIVGGMHESTPFYNTDPVNSFEFFPPKEGGVPRFSPFLERTGPVNLFPRAIALPDGKVFMAANNQSMIYDIETDTELRLPDIPNGVRITNPQDGTITLLPLSPPHYIPEILICGGNNASDTAPTESLSAFDPAASQCSRIALTPAGIAKGWEVEHMPEGRIMPDMVLLPDERVVIVNGGATGYAAFDAIGTMFGISHAANPVFTPVIYDPDAPRGRRMIRDELPTSDIPRMYHSTATLTPQGNVLIGGSNPHYDIQILPPGEPGFSSEFRLETLDPPFWGGDRPVLSNVPSQIGFNQKFTINVDIPSSLDHRDIKVSLIDLGFATHAFHSSTVLVFMDFTLSSSHKSLEVVSPPNNRVYPPGPAYIFVTVGGTWSVGARVMVGTGQSPPVQDQGVRV